MSLLETFLSSTLRRSAISGALGIGLALLSNVGYAQANQPKDTIPYFALDQCIAYALQYQPHAQQAMIDVDIARKTNAINLSGWYPQVNLSANLYHYMQLPTSLIYSQTNPEAPPTPEKTGLSNTSTPQLSVTQTLFNPALLFSAQAAHLLVEQAKQASDSTKIGIIAGVSKSFYNLLLNIEQIGILQEDTARLGKTVRDAFNQYKGGLVDKTDYKEAIIALNNSKAQLKQASENVVPLYAALQVQMGFSPDKKFNINFDTTQMKKDIVADTNQPLKFENRIEFQLLSTAQGLQKQYVNYYKYDYLPTISAFYSYNYEFENNNFGDLFTQAYPYSYIGASINIPIFTGFARIENLEKAKLQGQLLELDAAYLKTSIYAEYTAALANYKSNLYNLEEIKQNDALAKDVYAVVTLQYKQGIVPYLNVITAETNLISSDLSYINTLFQVLSSKVDLEKAMGNISPKH